MEAAPENGADAPAAVPKEEPAADAAPATADEGAATAGGEDANKGSAESTEPAPVKAEEGGAPPPAAPAVAGTDTAAVTTTKPSGDAEGGGETKAEGGDTKLLKELDDEAPKTFPQVVRTIQHRFTYVGSHYSSSVHWLFCEWIRWPQ